MTSFRFTLRSRETRNATWTPWSKTKKIKSHIDDCVSGDSRLTSANNRTLQLAFDLFMTMYNAKNHFFFLFFFFKQAFIFVRTDCKMT